MLNMNLAGKVFVLMAGIAWGGILSLRAQEVWSDADIGTVGTAGSESYNSSTDVFTVNGAGTGFGENADSGNLTSLQVSGNVEIIGHVGSLQDTSTSATAGLMMRESSAANAVSAYIAVTPSNGITFTARTATASSSTTVQGPSGAAPIWLRLARNTMVVNGQPVSGSFTVTGYSSTDGTNWTLVGTQIITMANTIQMGMAVSSGTTSETAAASFDHIDAMTNVPQLSSSLIGWYRADVGATQTSGAVSAWADQSGNGNNATQTTGSEQPTFVANSLNGQPTLQFNNANNTYLAMPNSAEFNPSQVTIIAVVDKTSSGTYSRTIVSKADGSTFPYNLYVASGTTATFQLNNHVIEGTATFANDTYGVLEGVYDETSARIYINGSLSYSTPYSTPLVTTNTNPASIGGENGGGVALDGNIAEVFIYNQGLTDVQRHNVEAYLYQKYGVGTEPPAASPTLSEGAGTYSSGQTVTLTPGQNGDTVYYTTDGSNPTSSGTRVAITSATTITINSTTTLQFVESGTGFINSSITNATYTIDPTSNFPRNGLIAWYRADVGVTQTSGAVSVWADQSGNGNNATQTTSSQQPTLVTNSLNGLPTLQFNYANNTYLGIANSAGLNPPQLSIIAVVRKTSGTSTARTVVAKTYGSPWPYTLYIENAATATFGLNDYAIEGTATFTNNTYGVLEGVYDETSARIYVNGSISFSSAYSTPIISTNTSLVSIGGQESTNGVSLDGNIAEILIYNQGLTDIQRHDVEAYLYQKYGVGTEPPAASPTLSESTGIYDNEQTVTLTPGQVGDTVYYTTDGSNPSTSGTRLAIASATAISVRSTMTLQAVETASYFVNSPIISATYTIDPISTIPLSGLVGWYRADVGVTQTSGAVSAWADQSGNGNNATQSTSGNQPTLVTNSLNGKPALQFVNASNSYLSMPNTAGLNPPQMSIIAVVKKTSSTTAAKMVVGKAVASTYPYALDVVGATTPTYYLNSAAVTGTSTLTNSTYGILEGIYDEASARLYVNGTLGYSTNYATPLLATNTDPVSIGGESSGNSLDGDIAEILIYNTALTTQQRQQLEGYLYERYGIGNPPLAPLPQFSEPVGIYAATQQVTLTPGDSTGTAYYTTDGSDPSTSGTRTQLTGTTALTISSTTTVRTYVSETGYTSNAATAIYTIDSTSTFTHSGLVAWYRADAGVTQSSGSVSQWADQSGTGNNAAQLTSANQPTVVTNSLNSQPVLSFNGSEFLTVPDAATLKPANLTVITVGKYLSGNSTYAGYVAKTSSTSETDGYFLGFEPTQNDPLYFWAGVWDYGYARTTPTANTYQVMEGEYNGASVNFWINGTSVATASYSTPITYVTGTPLTLGGTFSTEYDLTGSIAEVMIFNQPLSTTDRQNVEAYLYHRYGLGIVPMPVITSPTTATGTAGTSFTYTSTSTNTPTSYSATGLPPGLTLNTTTGAITGTPTMGGTYTIVLSATNSSGTSTTPLTFTFSVPLVAPVINSATTASATAGTPFSYNITATNLPTSFTETGTLPAGLSFNATTGTISGTPTTAGTSTVTLGAANSGGASTGVGLTLTVSSPAVPVVNSPATVSGDVGVPFIYTITASNNPVSATETGTLPAGLSFNSTTGVISGTPTTTGTATLTVGAVNAGGTGTETLTLIINSSTAPIISSPTSVVGLNGTAFNYTPAASNTPTSYTLTGTLPAGLSFNSTTGVISGTPTGTGNSTSTVTIGAVNDNGTGSTSLTFDINPPAPVLGSGGTAAASAGSAFYYAIPATNAPTSFNATGLPPGLILNTSTGVISGTPTTTGGSPTTYTVTLSAINAGGSATSTTMTITVGTPLPVPVISSPSLATGDIGGTAFSYAVTTATLPAPTSYSATGLPPGLSINTSTGVISGTPTTTGTYTVTITASNSYGSGVETVTLKINSATTPIISSAITATALVGSSYSYSITASQTPTSYSATGLPSGLSLNASTGVISGTPTQVGYALVTLNATNSAGTGSTILTLTINPAIPVITSPATASGSFGVAFTPYTIAASNNPTSFSATGLPPGLLLDPGTGMITGTPTMGGTFTVTLSATNAGGPGMSNLVVTVASSATQPMLTRSIAAGYNNTLLLRSDGSVWASGEGYDGQLGNGGNADSDTALKVPGLTNIVSVAEGYDFSYALGSDGTVWAWGYNWDGELGNGSSQPAGNSTPARVTVSGGGTLTGIIALSAGYDFGMALRNDGTVWAWGYGYNGQLGNGGGASSLVAVQVATATGSLTGIVAISCGNNHGLAVRNDGTVWAWGNDPNGELGDGGTMGSSNVAVQVPLSLPTGVGITSVAGGETYSLAMASDGTVWAWGDESEGHLGNGVTSGKTTPIQVTDVTGAPLSGVNTISAQGDHTLVLKNDGTVWAWGENEYGQLGTGTVSENSAVPVQVSNLNGVIAISAGFSTNAALESDGSIWGWGYNGDQSDYGAGGLASSSTLPVTMPSLTGITAIAGAKGHYLALDTNGNVWTWNDTTPGEVSDGVTIIGSSSAVQVPGLSGITAIACEAYSNLALKNDGTVWAWGYNADGELGNGTTTPAVDTTSSGLIDLTAGSLTTSQTPTQVVTSGGTVLSNVTAIAGGGYYGMALDTSGTVWTWGNNSDGQLGNNSSANSSIAAPIYATTGLGTITAISAGFTHGMALDSSGNVWTWGGNDFGGLGYATSLMISTSFLMNSSNVPAKITGLSGITAISAAYYHSVALDSSGNVWTWGLNEDGELGNGTTTNGTTPAQITTLSGITAIQTAEDSYHSVALKSDGTVWTWGSNANGQLGVGSSGAVGTTGASPTGSKIPVQVIGLSGVTISKLACEKFGTAVLTTGGTVMQWGDTSYQPLGSSVPIQVEAPLTNPAPVISPGTGSYASSQSISISTSLTTGTIYYTLDGTEPTASSPAYTGSFTLSGDALVSAAVFVSGVRMTPIVSSQFYINDSNQTGLATAPTGLTTTVVSGGQINLSWSLGSLADFNAINVYRSSDGGATYQLIATLGASATSYSDTNVQSGTNYLYKVGAANASGVSNTGATASVTPTAATTLTITVTSPAGVSYLP